VNAHWSATDRKSVYCCIVLVPYYKVYFETNTHFYPSPFSFRFFRYKYRPFCPTPQAWRPPEVSIILYPFPSLSIFATLKKISQCLDHFSNCTGTWKVIARLQPAKNRCVLVSICSTDGRRPSILVVSQPVSSWLKDYSFPLLPSMAIIRRLVTTTKGRELTELSFWVWGSGFVNLCWVVFYFHLLAGLEVQPLCLFELRRRPRYLLVLNLVSFGDFEFSLDLCSFGITDGLPSECFGAHR